MLKITESLIEATPHHGQFLDIYLKPIHVDTGPFDDLNETSDAFLDRRVNNFLHRQVSTPDRWEKMCLYLLMMSVVVGSGHFSKVPLRSFSAERSSA